MRRRRTTRLLAVAAAATLALTACSNSDDGGSSDDGTTEASSDGATESDGGPITGTIVITSGECDGGAITGSYFRMVQPDGTLADGPFIENGDSTCVDKTFSPLLAGDTGLVLGEHQPFGDPVFDADGNALATDILQPTPFFAVGFGVGTSPVEPQTEVEVPAPSLTAAADGSVTGDLRAFSVAYNGSYFAQGTPAPDGSMPGLTSAITGTYDAASGAIVLEWSAQIVGGAFNNFTGIWHLEGAIGNGG